MRIEQIHSSKVRVSSAYIAQSSNTDRRIMRKSLHIVEGDLDGKLVNAFIWAKDPDEAIEQANKMPHHITWHSTN